jgi:hypothetical protein
MRGFSDALSLLRINSLLVVCQARRAGYMQPDVKLLSTARDRELGVFATAALKMIIYHFRARSATYDSFLKATFSLLNPSRSRVLTVPIDSPVRAAISVWVKP